MNAWNEKSSGNSEQLAETSDLKFEDNFSSSINTNRNSQNPEKLPDSDEYLFKLESRLQRIKTNPDVLQQLAERREACMNNLLNNLDENLAHSDSDVDFDQPIQQNETASEIIRYIRPEQAQTVGEIVHIIQHDQLDEEYVADSNSDNSSVADR